MKNIHIHHNISADLLAISYNGTTSKPLRALFKAIGFAYDQTSRRWLLRPVTTQGVHFSKRFKEVIEQHAPLYQLDILPSYTPSLDALEQKRFNIVSIAYYNEKGSLSVTDWLVFEPNKVLALLIGRRFAYNRYTKHVKQVTVTGSAYLTRGRKLFDEKRIITPEISPLVLPDPSTHTTSADPIADTHADPSAEVGSAPQNTLSMPTITPPFNISDTLKRFLPQQQRAYLYSLSSEAQEALAADLAALTATLQQIPKASQGTPLFDQLVYAHYFIGNSDWWVLDHDPSQDTVFAYVVLGGDADNGEAGSVALEELKTTQVQGRGIELDFYWTPKPLKDILIGEGYLLEAPEAAPTTKMPPPQAAPKYYNEYGVYTKELAGERMETLTIAFPNSIPFEAQLVIVRRGDDTYSYGLHMGLTKGSYAHVSSPVTTSTKAFAIKAELLAAAYDEIAAFISTQSEGADPTLVTALAKAHRFLLKDAHRQGIKLAGLQLKGLKKQQQQHKKAHTLNLEIAAFISEHDAQQLPYTDADKAYISQYTGAGGKIKQGATGKGILYEYYTDHQIVETMWGLVDQYLDAPERNVLEPACGIGHFIAYANPKANVVGYEINPTAKRICEILYPQATIIGKPFESHFFAGNIHTKDQFDSQRFDVVIGNPPYGTFTGKYAGMGEKAYTKATQYDHYFITRGLDILRPGGILCFIIPSAFLQNKSKYTPIKKRISQKAQLMTAYRLPQGMFPTTRIGTDIVVFKKNP